MCVREGVGESLNASERVDPTKPRSLQLNHHATIEMQTQVISKLQINQSTLFLCNNPPCPCLGLHILALTSSRGDRT